MTPINRQIDHFLRCNTETNSVGKHFLVFGVLEILVFNVNQGCSVAYMKLKKNMVLVELLEFKRNVFSDLH